MNGAVIQREYLLGNTPLTIQCSNGAVCNVTINVVRFDIDEFGEKKQVKVREVLFESKTGV